MIRVELVIILLLGIIRRVRLSLRRVLGVMFRSMLGNGIMRRDLRGIRFMMRIEVVGRLGVWVVSVSLVWLVDARSSWRFLCRMLTGLFGASIFYWRVMFRD